MALAINFDPLLRIINDESLSAGDKFAVWHDANINLIAKKILANVNYGDYREVFKGFENRIRKEQNINYRVITIRQQILDKLSQCIENAYQPTLENLGLQAWIDSVAPESAGLAKEVAKTIAGNYHCKATRLSLDFDGLANTKLPPVLASSEFSHIEHLILHGPVEGDLSGFEHLHKLSLCDTSITRIFNCPSLTLLSVKRCFFLTEVEDSLPCLKELTIKGCQNFKTISASLERLSILSIQDTDSLFSIPSLPSLATLSLKRSQSITKVPSLPLLFSCHIEDCPVEEFGCVENVSILTLINTLTQNLPEMPVLEVCTLEKNPISILPRYMSQLRELSVKNLEISEIPRAPKLKFLTVKQTPIVKIPTYPQLTHLSVRSAPKLALILRQPSIIRASIKDSNALTQIQGPSNDLVKLDCSGCSSLEEIPASEALQELNCQGCHLLKEIPEITRQISIKWENSGINPFCLALDLFQILAPLKKFFPQGDFTNLEENLHQIPEAFEESFFPWLNLLTKQTIEEFSDPSYLARQLTPILEKCTLEEDFLNLTKEVISQTSCPDSALIALYDLGVQCKLDHLSGSLNNKLKAFLGVFAYNILPNIIREQIAFTNSQNPEVNFILPKAYLIALLNFKHRFHIPIDIPPVMIPEDTEQLNLYDIREILQRNLSDKESCLDFLLNPSCGISDLWEKTLQEEPDFKRSLEKKLSELNFKTEKGKREVTTIWIQEWTKTLLKMSLEEDAQEATQPMELDL